MTTIIEEGQGRVERVVPVQTRSERPTSFEPADFGAPTGREVNFKYTPVRSLAPLTLDEDPDANAIEVRVDGAPGGVLGEGTDATAGGVFGEVFRPEDVMSAIAWKRGERLHVRIPEGCVLTEPVTVRVHGTGTGQRAAQHILVEAMPGSEATVVIEHDGGIALTQNVEVIVRDTARLNLVSVHEWEPGTIHASAHQSVVGRDAYLRHVIVSMSGAVVRVNPSLRLAGRGAEGEMYGLSFSDAGEHMESQVYLFHEGEQTRGDVLFKSALQGEGARAVWIGDVLIGPAATGTDSYEKNQNLMLTEGCRADSVPNLEIETGDIEGAGHASATGRFDDEQLFYLQSRGIPDAEARQLVVRGFLTEMIQKVPVAALRERLVEALEAELAAGAAASSSHLAAPAAAKGA